MPVNLQPEVVELRVGSEKHNKIIEQLRLRKVAGWEARSKREEKWADSENLFSAYVKETDLDSRKRAAREQQGLPQYTTVTIPYSYATLMTMHTYFASVFLSRTPTLQVQGRHGESVENEQAMETLLDYQMVVGECLMPLYIWLMDGGKYGEGWVCQYWCVEQNDIPEVFEVPDTFMGFPILSFGGGTKMKKVTQMRRVTNYSGNKLFNIRPQDFYHDPTVTAANVQLGGYVGWQRIIAYNTILRREALGYYFNVDKIQPYQNGAQSNRSEGQNTYTPSNAQSWNLLQQKDGDKPVAVMIDETIVELVPREWGLAARDGLEKWAFTWVNEEVIIGCQPLGLYHNKYPVDKCEYEIEGYNLSKRGVLEMIKPLNDTLDWLINTHFYNVRKSLNNEWVYDPSVLMQKDVERPGPGKLIRVRPERYGSDITKSFYQVPVQDVTQNHIRDAQLIIEMMQRLTGVNDTVMGMLGTKRQTATEVRTSSSFSVNRLKTLCEYISTVGFGPMTQKLIGATQQLYDQELEYRIRGLGSGQRSVVKIDPNAIAGAYDYVPVDGTLPIDRMAQAQMFGQLMQQAASIPPVAQQLDWMMLFGYTAKNLMGIKNFDSFKVQVAPDGQALANAQAGNTVPMNQLMPPPNG